MRGGVPDVAYLTQIKYYRYLDLSINFGWHTDAMKSIYLFISVRYRVVQKVTPPP